MKLAILLLGLAGLIGTTNAMCRRNLTSMSTLNWAALQGIWYVDSFLYADSADESLSTPYGLPRDYAPAQVTCAADRIYVGHNSSMHNHPYVRLDLHDAGLNYEYGQTYYYGINSTDHSICYTGWGWGQGKTMDQRWVPWTDYKSYAVMYECNESMNGQVGRVIILGKSTRTGVGMATRKKILKKLQAKGWATNGLGLRVPWTFCRFEWNAY